MEEKQELLQIKIKDLEYKLENSEKVTVIMANTPNGPQICMVATRDAEAQRRVDRARKFMNEHEDRLQKKNITMSIQTEIPINQWYYTPEGSVY